MPKGLPSAQQLAYLRKSGIVFWSPGVTRSIVVAVLFFGLYLAASQIEPWFQVDVASEPSAALRNMWILFLQVVGGLAAGALLVGVGASLIQTRGAIGWRVLREACKREHSRQRTVASLAGVLLAMGLAPYLLYLFVPGLLEGLRAADRRAAIFGFLSSFCKVVVVAAVVLAILVWIVTRLLFLFAHRDRTDRERE
jgi:hypothetical protein